MGWRGRGVKVSGLDGPCSLLHDNPYTAQQVAYEELLGKVRSIYQHFPSVLFQRPAVGQICLAGFHQHSTPFCFCCCIPSLPINCSVLYYNLSCLGFVLYFPEVESTYGMYLVSMVVEHTEPVQTITEYVHVNCQDNEEAISRTARPVTRVGQPVWTLGTNIGHLPSCHARKPNLLVSNRLTRRSCLEQVGLSYLQLEAS